MCGTKEHGFVVMAVIGQWLDWKILVAFSYFNDSMILWFYKVKYIMPI